MLKLYCCNKKATIEKGPIKVLFYSKWAMLQKDTTKRRENAYRHRVVGRKREK